jgi:glycosyltransferase involved in cell wall biosynthesis
MANIVFMLDYQGKNLQIGGASNHINLLAPRVKRAGFDVRIAMPVSPRTSTLYSSLESASVTVDVVDTSPQAGNALRRLHTAFRYFLARRPDVVHFVMPWWNACDPGIMGAWLARVPVRVATYHAVPEAIDPQVFRGVSGLARRQRHRFTRGCIDKAVSVCAAISQRLVANGLYTSERVVVIRNGVDTKSLSSANSGVDYRRKWSVGESRFLITVIGYLEEIKGHHYLLEALPAIVQRHTNVLVAFVGDGVLRASLEAQAHAKNLADHVVFTG